MIQEEKEPTIVYEAGKMVRVSDKEKNLPGFVSSTNHGESGGSGNSLGNSGNNVGAPMITLGKMVSFVMKITGQNANFFCENQKNHIEKNYILLSTRIIFSCILFTLCRNCFIHATLPHKNTFLRLCRKIYNKDAF